MCFSAEASFCASALIGTIGVISVRKSTTFPQKMFAIIPLFFAIQQLMEGFLWVVISNPEYIAWKQPLIIGFLIFAWLVWPVYIPFSMALFEKNTTRRRILLGFLGMGFLLILCFLYILIFHTPDASADQLHINYTYDYQPPVEWVWGLIYFIPTVVSLMISSKKKMWIFGVINLCSYIFSRIYFSGHVLSVWCFFGAVGSAFILWAIIQMNKVPETSEQRVNQAT
ncbi:MAG TPA: hypothetical protein PKN48_09290 [Bacteroidales bacterium]|nr:hypothetical protein [Bacteroidales bacterium]